MLVGKTGYGPSCKQDEINALMISLASAGQARGAAQGRRPDDLRPRRRGDRGLPRRRHRGRGGARHQRRARRRQPARHLAHPPREVAAACNMSPAMAPTAICRPTSTGSSLADPTATTIVYMPGKTIRELAATRHRAWAGRRDTPPWRSPPRRGRTQQVVSGTIADIAERMEAGAGGAGAGDDRAGARGVVASQAVATAPSPLEGEGIAARDARSVG